MKFGRYDVGPILRPYLEGGHDWSVWAWLITSFHISVKLNAFNIKLKSIVPEVIQRLCAKFGANWPIGGTIMDVNAFLPLTSTF